MAGEWITYVQAAERLGVTPGTVRKMLNRGDLRRRPGERPRRDPSVDAASVDQLQVVLEQQRADRQARAARRAVAGQPPDTGHDWLTARQTADLLGLSVKWVHARAREEKIPAVEHGGRWWVRGDHAELVRAARDARPLGSTGSERGDRPRTGLGRRAGIDAEH